MRGDDPPALEQAHPHLALASGNGAAIDGALELQGDAAEVAAKGDDVQAPHGALEIHRRTAGTERGDFVEATQVFRRSEAHIMRRSPEQPGERADIVADESGFILGIERLQLRNCFGVIDLQVCPAPIRVRGDTRTAGKLAKRRR